MLFKTHLAIGFFVALFFLSHVSHKLSFIPIVLLASILPDIDSAFSKLGRSRLFRIVQFFTKHRGVLHSFTFCFIVSLFFAFYIPILALPFFIGYSLHLFVDSLTIEGIRPFWPSKAFSKGKIPVGGAVDEAIFLTFCLVDVIFIVSFFF